MKNCKKIIALILAVVMTFSVFVYCAGAEDLVPTTQTQEQQQDDVTTTDPNDLSYVAPTYPSTTEKTDFGDLFPSGTLDNLGKTSRTVVDFFKGIFDWFKDLLDIILNTLNQMSDVFNGR